jgi:hypothetical protein
LIFCRSKPKIRAPAHLVKSQITCSNLWVRATTPHEIVRNKSINHIPIGIYFDLIDGVTTGESTRNENGPANRTLSDPVGGAFNNF